MFLIQMWSKSVLYTGDIRAEAWWVEALTKEPLLAPFMGSHQPDRHNHQSEHKLHPPLDNIYLDTSGLFSKKEVLSKVPDLHWSVSHLHVIRIEPGFTLDVPRNKLLSTRSV